MGSLVSLTLFADSSDLKSAPHTDNSAAAEENSSPRTVLFSLREAVISSLVEARVNRHNFKEGERFKANDVLTELDEETFRQRLLKSESALVEAKAATGFAERNLVRTKALHARGMLGLQDVERCEFEVETAKSKQTFHEANVKLAEQDLAACRISAPFPGRLVKILVQEHEFVKMGQPLLQIIDDYRLLAIAHLPSSGISNIKIGQVISINVDETGTVHSGKVYVISGEVDSASRTFEIKILIENPDGKLSSGMSGRLVTAPLSEGASE
jgi:RND family efflux transporter MFP subunit